ncbi:MAG: hypothetical protein HFE63_10300 [Clostridiales bacterium]|nr:hypothetical protein [Clostridiales bacterium]
MVKGCQKKIIVVNQTGSKYFDSAYFILKGELPRGSSEHDMMKEAQNIVDGCSAEQLFAASLLSEPANNKKRPKKRLDSVIAFFSGAAMVGAVVGAVSLAANLLF